MRHFSRNLTLLLLASAAISLSASGGQRVAPRTVDHVVIMVFDQMRPDYIDRFGLENFKRLRSRSRNYPDAYVGHMGSQTVVAHTVIPTGLRPGDLPWVDEAVVDTDGLLGKPGLPYKTGKLTRDQYFTLLKRIPREQFLQARIQDTLGGKVFGVGSKDYAATLFGGPHASAIVTLTPTCAPDGMNVPEYITSNRRFTVDCTPTHGTNYKSIYKLEGNISVPGKDPEHLGGDMWTADAAIEIMKREKWSGMLLTFSGIDKVAHMLGEQDGHGLKSVPSEYHLEDVLRIADEQLGRVLASLDAQGLTDRTLVVVTADHGGQRNEYYMGNNGDQTCCRWADGKDVKSPYWVEHLNALSGDTLRTAYAATSLHLWLGDRSPAVEAAITAGMKDVPGITEIYILRRQGNTYRYEQTFSALASQPAKFRRWAEQHSAELMATMAGPAAPDMVGLLADGYGFGRIGVLGGAQELVQRIPMIIHVPGESGSKQSRAMRLMDIAPEVTRILGLKPAPAPVVK